MFLFFCLPGVVACFLFCFVCVCVLSVFVETTKTIKGHQIRTNVKDTPQPLTSIVSRRALYKGEPLTSTCLYSLGWWRQMPARHAVILEAGSVRTLCESLLRPNPSRHRARLKAIEVRGQGGIFDVVSFLCFFTFVVVVGQKNCPGGV